MYMEFLGFVLIYFLRSTYTYLRMYIYMYAYVYVDTYIDVFMYRIFRFCIDVFPKRKRFVQINLSLYICVCMRRIYLQVHFRNLVHIGSLPWQRLKANKKKQKNP
jgi:hypothetical protein